MENSEGFEPSIVSVLALELHPFTDVKFSSDVGVLYTDSSIPSTERGRVALTFLITSNFLITRFYF